MHIPPLSEIELQTGTVIPPDAEIQIIDTPPFPNDSKRNGFKFSRQAIVDYMGQKWIVFLKETLVGNIVVVYLFLSSTIGAPIPSPYRLAVVSAETFINISKYVFDDMANDSTFADSYLAALPAPDILMPTGNQTQWDNLPIGTGIYPVSSGFLDSI